MHRLRWIAKGIQGRTTNQPRKQHEQQQKPKTKQIRTSTCGMCGQGKVVVLTVRDAEAFGHAPVRRETLVEMKRGRGLGLESCCAPGEASSDRARALRSRTGGTPVREAWGTWQWGLVDVLGLIQFSQGHGEQGDMLRRKMGEEVLGI